MKGDILVFIENVIYKNSGDFVHLQYLSRFKELAKLFISLKERPTAIFAVNDITAFGIIQQLADDGISVPEDVSVVGFDNIEVSKMVNPPLTTIKQPSYETGRIAGKMLIDSLGENTEKSNFTITLEPSIIVRKSVRQI